MEMSVPVYTLKEIPVEAVTFAAPLAISGHLPSLFQQTTTPAEGSLVLPPGGQLLAVSGGAHPAGSSVPGTVQPHSGTLTQLAVSSGTFTPLTVSSAAPTSVAVSSASLTPLAVSSAALTQLSVSSASLTPLSVSPAALTPLSVSSAGLTPLAVSSAGLTPLAVSSAGLTSLVVSSAGLTPLSASSAGITPLAVSSAPPESLPVSCAGPMLAGPGPAPSSPPHPAACSPSDAPDSTLDPSDLSSSTAPATTPAGAPAPAPISAPAAALAHTSTPAPAPVLSRASVPAPASVRAAAVKRRYESEQPDVASESSAPGDPADPAQEDEDEQEWTPRRKRNRIDLTIEQKRQICLYHNENRTATAKQMVDFFHKEWGVTVGRSTIAATIGNKAKWLSMSEQKAKSKRTRAGKHEQMEQRLYGWYMDRRAAGVYVSREQLFAQAKEIGFAVGIPETFSYSKGWLQKFQMRYNFRVTSEKSKTDAASKRFVLFKRKQMDRDLETTAPADIFCFGEFRLCYQLVPRQSMVATTEALREHDSAVSICLCTNMTGCRRLPPLVLGRSVTCGFSSKFSVDKLLQYRYSARGTLTDAIFSEWLYRVDETMRREQRSVVLLIGATSCNVERTYKLSNVKLRFLSTIGARSPFEEGIRAAFKIAYRRLQVQHLLGEVRHHVDTAAPDLRDAMYLIRESWRQMPDALIVGAWLAVGVVPEYRLAGAQTTADGAAEGPEGEVRQDQPDQQQQQQVMPLPAGHQAQPYYYTSPQQSHQQHPQSGPLPPPHDHPHHQPPAPHQQHHLQQQQPQLQQHVPHEQQQHQQQQSEHQQQHEHQHRHQQPPSDQPHHEHQQQQQHYQPPLQPPPPPQQQQQFFPGLQQLTSVGTYDPGLGQHFLAPFGLPHNGNTYILPDQQGELRPTSPSGPKADPPQPPPAPPPPLLPDPGELNLASIRLLKEDLSRLAIPADDLVTAEWLLAADDLHGPEPPDAEVSDSEPVPGSASFIRPPEHVTQTVARWAADVLLAYLEQRDADLGPIDNLLDIRKRWVLSRGRPEPEQGRPPGQPSGGGGAGC